MITVFFRYDDYSSLSSPEVDRGVIDIFARHGLSCTFAVVPAITSIYPWVEGSDQQELPLSKEKMAELRDAVSRGAVDLALHGWRHLANQYTCHPDPSEFKGLSVDEQVKILQRGRDFLAEAAGAPPVLFVPPWNSYDDNTLKALELTGFRGISASRYSPWPNESASLIFAPMTTELGGLRAAIEDAIKRGETDAVIGVMMHPYDFKESGDKRAVISLEQFEQEIRWIKEKQGVQIQPISSFLKTSSMNRERFLANRPSVLENSYPPVVARVESDLVYHSAADARGRKTQRDALFIAILVLLAIAGAAAGWIAASIVSQWLPPLRTAMPFAVLLAMGLLALRAFRAGAIYTRGAALMAVLSGVFIVSIA